MPSHRLNKHCVFSGVMMTGRVMVYGCAGTIPEEWMMFQTIVNLDLSWNLFEGMCAAVGALIHAV